jgi:hypothetical protein
MVACELLDPNERLCPMNACGTNRSGNGSAQPFGRWGELALGFLLLTAGAAGSLQAQGTVTTLGGGRLTPNGSDAGFTDGNILQSSQFNTPSGCALDASGRLYVADLNNGALRRLDLAADRCQTVLTGLNHPTAVAVDSANVVYVLSQGDGTIQKIDRGVVSALSTGLAAPAAMAYDGANSLYVAQGNGTVVQVTLPSGAVSAPILAGLNRPGGIAVLDNGWIAVSETGGSMIRIWNPGDGSMEQQIGTGMAGFTDGPASLARFNQPYHLAKAPGGNLVVADRANDRVRLIGSDGFVSTLYGVDPSTWEGPACTSCVPIILPGWLDGSVDYAEAREPVGITIGTDGTIYTTEVFYHLVRKVVGVPLTGTGGTGSTKIVVLPPVISPNSGYYPMGQTITISNPNASSLVPSQVFYTTDGTEPTTNSFQVNMSGSTGTIFWQEKTHDLTSLRLKAFLGSSASDTISGQPVSTTEIGVTQDIAAGPGSTAIVPIVVNLATNAQLQSLQFRVEITPNSDSLPMIPETLQALSLSTNDFIPLYTGSSGKGPASFKAASYSFGQTRGLAITYLGTNANLQLKDFGAVAMLAVPIPPSVQAGDTYTISVLNPSGTADGAQERVTMNAMPARSLTVASAQYLVGDSSPATWYNAAQFDASGSVRTGFGDGLLDNSDVNNVFAAAMGLRVPYPNTDLFDAMDAYPEDTADAAGGDGSLRYLDWQVVLLRSLGLDLARWERTWSEGGVRVVQNLSNNGSPSSPGQTLSTPLPGAVWNRQVILSAQSVADVVPGQSFDVPVFVQVAPGAQLAGLAFRAIVEPNGAAPAIGVPVQFVASANLPPPPQNAVPSANTALCGWPLVPSSSFDPPLQGSNLLGYVRLTLPLNSYAGQSYTLRFANADGSPDLQTQYDFDTKPGLLWVLGPALQSPPATSDEWKQHFFGSLTSAAAMDDADPDNDGVPNWAEYAAGTDPTNNQSYLHLAGVQSNPTRSSVSLRWLSAPGKLYALEGTSSLLNPNWTTLVSNLAGDGSVQQWVQTNLTAGTQFYRIRLQP